MLAEKQDAFGRGMLEYYSGCADQNEIVERDDGLITVGLGPGIYFEEFENWRPHEKQAAKFARGRILDIGCGAGRVSLYFQNNGHRVTGIDLSPLAIKVCRRRGLKDARVLPVTRISKSLGRFDTVVMFGNNFGLFGSFKAGQRFLKRLYVMTSDNARIIAESLDPYDTKEKMHKEYHRRNRNKGRMGGQLKLRIRYKQCATPWFDYLLVSKEEAQEILSGTGWVLSKTIQSGSPKSPGPAYMMIIEKEPA